MKFYIFFEWRVLYLNYERVFLVCFGEEIFRGKVGVIKSDLDFNSVGIVKGIKRFVFVICSRFGMI